MKTYERLFIGSEWVAPSSTAKIEVRSIGGTTTGMARLECQLTKSCLPTRRAP